MKLRQMRWAGHAARMGTKINSYHIFVWKLERKGPGCICENNIEMDLKEIGREAINWFNLTQDGANAELL
jgi:hypothetical protein